MLPDTNTIPVKGWYYSNIVYTPTPKPVTVKDMQTITLVLTSGHSVTITGNMEALFEIASKLGGQLSFNPPKAQSSTPGIRGPRKTPEQKQQIVADYKASGMSAQAFCDAHPEIGIGAQSLYQWVRDQDDGSKAEGTESGPASVRGESASPKRGKGKKS